jgi:hypothetical protein
MENHWIFQFLGFIIFILLNFCKMKDLNLRKVTVMRYILPLREGGSLPALAEADDDFKYVLKFRGAGHGVKMLISELLGGKIAEIRIKNS